MNERRYRYRGRTGSMLFGSVLGLGIAAFAGYALLNGWAIRLYSAYIQPDMARWFYGFFVVLGLALVVISIRVLFAGAREIVVTPTAITMPKSESSRTLITVNAGDIRQLKLSTYNNIHSLHIRHSGGTTKVPAPNFASPAEFNDFVDTVQSIAPVR